MKTIEELEREYQTFICKTIKTANDFYNDLKNLSPENLQRFKNGIKANLPIEIANIIRFLEN